MNPPETRRAAICAMLFCLIFCLLSTGAAASEKEPVEGEDVVVTATRTEKAIKDAPGSIEVISEQKILDMNSETVAQALEEATSLVVSGAPGKQKAPRIRGAKRSHSLILIDGRRIASGFKAMRDLEQVPLDLVKRIEVIRGPASALYGSEALGGVINVITKKPPEELNMGGSAQYGHRSGDTDKSRGSAYIGNSWGPFGFLLAGGLQAIDGYNVDGGVPNDGDDISLETSAGRFSYDIGDNHELLAGFEYIDKTDENVRFMKKKLRDWEDDEERQNYYLQYNAMFSPTSNLTLLANHSRQRNEVEIDPPTAGVDEDGYDENKLDQLESHFTQMFGNHLLTIGAEYTEEELEEAAGDDYSVDNLSFYAQDEWQVFNPLYLVLGGRYDDHSDFGSEFTPRASMIYNLFDNLRVKASYGTGFRAPSITELFVAKFRRQATVIHEPNPDLDPEESQSYEIGLEGEYKNLNGRITAFRNEFDDMIEPIFYKTKTLGGGKKKEFYYRMENIAQATTQGVEFEGRMDLPYGFWLTGNLAYLETEDEETGEDLDGRPDYKGSVKMGYAHLPLGIRSNIRANYVGERSYADQDEDDFIMVDSYLSKKLTKRLKMFGGVDNIFNAGDERGQEPRLFYAGISLNY